MIFQIDLGIQYYNTLLLIVVFISLIHVEEDVGMYFH